MARLRCLITAVWLLAYVSNQAQTVYYPAGASQLLRSTAEDIAMLMQKAIPGSSFTTQQYTAMPSSGIILAYDNSINGNQTCRVQGNGAGKISFSAAQDNGLTYGVYEYLYELGFRFYQPGAIWEYTPVLNGAFRVTDTVYSGKIRYKNWFISGGYNKWAMDQTNDYYWDIYNGEQGHAWALYMRRNNMIGEYRFAGHRDDIMTNDYMEELQKNPCYVAPYNNTRAATRQSVPDVNNAAAVNWWSSSIEKKYSTFYHTIHSNTGIYPDYYHNFNYAYGNIGIEVPDGAHWANSADNSCGSYVLSKASDQQFLLASKTASSIAAVYPDKRYQVYAYDSHADIPSASVAINNKIDVQVVPTAFQFETSAKALLNRWYSRYNNISEYHYLNLAQWCGETPAFFFNELENTIQRLKEKQSQGIVWEAAPSKFASLPFLLAANLSLKNNVPMKETLREFCDRFFEDASPVVYQLLQYWSDDKTVMVGNGIQDNRYKLPFYFQLVRKADELTQNAPAQVQSRITELKAYLHYMRLYYDWAFDQRPVYRKKDKAAALCNYLAGIQKRQVVNSYFLLNDIVNRYTTDSDIYSRYNTTNGTVYQQGLLAQYTEQEIDQFFETDLDLLSTTVTDYHFMNAADIAAQFTAAAVQPLDKIDVQVGYTNGKDYTARTEIYILARQAGTFSVQYAPRFDMQDKGLINFAVEYADKPLGVIKDFTIGNGAAAGSLQIALPSAGIYKFSVVSKYRSAVTLNIKTNGLYFFRNGPFLGNSIENYRSNLMSLPGYFYVPAGVKKVFFSLNNSNPGGAGHATADEISRAFVFYDPNGNRATPMLVNNTDSALFYLDAPADFTGGFWQSFKMEQYRLCLANVSNIYWYVQRKGCSAADFKVSVKQVNGICVTELESAQSLTWVVYDAQQWHGFSGKTVILPPGISPNAIVTASNGNGCSVKKRLADDAAYLQQQAYCSTGASPAMPDATVKLYPNPSAGIFNCQQNGNTIMAEEVVIYNSTGLRMASFFNVRQFNISQLPAGIYFYTIVINKVAYKGRIVKT